ncbi:hypothetical protein Tdes44962_MAKER02090 [Teratosphaeria destructans]|uniref:TeaA receptor TeaR n=1 Tax=Teratosphaeria destructans TaxID=418781 RepID=A0A9W7SV78_9PEZI|nr:hypothetical protein Tdes44962_MAKER02090 [Teratosphaeria destructans]
MATAVNGGWAYAVPLDETTGFSQPVRRDTGKTQESHANGTRSRSASQRRPSDFGIMADSEMAAGSRRASSRASNSVATRKRSKNALRSGRLDDKTGAPQDGKVDDSKWIHRDKLAQIEIQEMEEAGIHVRSSRRSMSAGPAANGRLSRSQSRSGARRAISQDRRHDDVEELLPQQDYPSHQHQIPKYASFDDYKRVSTIPAEEEEDRRFDPVTDSEIRTPEELAAEQQHNKQHMTRPSTSRIPISKASPLPLPQNVVGRDSPLPRSRNGSGAWGNGGWDELQYAKRARSGSAGSQVLLDDYDAPDARPGSSHLGPSNENSPPKSRVPTKVTPGNRKTSVTLNGRPGSSGKALGSRGASSATQRPTSSSGHKKRASLTGHTAPEGEPPWAATMYKPDPRIPPDQQMLPTHAKRMMQEQWEKEGKTGTVYDRDFNLLNDEPFKQQRKNSKSPPILKLDENADQSPDETHQQTDGKLPPIDTRLGNAPSWPLSPTNKSDAGGPPSRPGTSGGYKITPTIPSPPLRSPAPSAAHSIPSTNPNAQPLNATPRIPDLDEKDVPEPKKGCCCILM